MTDVQLGDSIAVNVVCLTAVEFDKNHFVADVSNETITLTSLKSLATGSEVNLEKDLLPTTRLGGHLGSGHVDGLGEIISIKEDMVLNGNPNMQTKVMLTMFSLFAEIERDLISERTKEGLKRARAEGKLLGRPKGLGKSKLDSKVAEIKDYMSKGVNLTNIARIYGVSYGTMKHFVDTRGLR